MLSIAYIVLFLSVINLLRMGLFLVGSDIYDIKKSLSTKKQSPSSSKNTYKPLVSVLVPAHNEELVLRRNLESVLKSTYKKIELIVINDSSTDRTYRIARTFQQQHGDHFKKIRVLNVQVRGKASALNAGLKYANGSLFMCLDADSTVTPDAIEIAVRDFSNPKVACVASNVKIFPDKGALNLFQQIEYLIGYQAKKTESLGGIQYIVGGIGSMFRTQLVRRLGGYDTDTVTEDIDLSMKILSKYGRKYLIGYNPKMVTYTESVNEFGGLLRQRFRWKYGRYQSFLKYKNLFFARGSNTNKVLGWVYLPYALISEIMCILELFTIILICVLLTQYGSFNIIAASFITFTAYTVLNVTAATTGGYSLSERIRFIAAAPFAYLGLYVLSVVEYSASIYGFVKLRKIYRDHKTGLGGSSWKHVERRGTASIS